jgi:hypothetical protein
MSPLPAALPATVSGGTRVSDADMFVLDQALYWYIVSG